jgi:hypothetical protein
MAQEMLSNGLLVRSARVPRKILHKGEVGGLCAPYEYFTVVKWRNFLNGATCKNGKGEQRGVIILNLVKRI